jgi:hypothetical protein
MQFLNLWCLFKDQGAMTMTKRIDCVVCRTGQKNVGVKDVQYQVLTWLNLYYLSSVTRGIHVT